MPTKYKLILEIPNWTRYILSSTGGQIVSVSCRNRTRDSGFSSKQTQTVYKPEEAANEHDVLMD